MTSTSSNISPWSISVKTVGTATSSNGDNFTVTVSPDDNFSALHDQIEYVTGLKAYQQRLIYRGRIISSTSNNENITDENRGNLSLNNSDRCSSPVENEEINSDNIVEAAIAKTANSSSGACTNDENHDSRKIRDISGLGDGQTIHLVPRLITKKSKNDDKDNATPATTTNNNEPSREDGASDSNDPTALASGMGAASLLAALLGLGAMSDSDNLTDDDNNTSAVGGDSPEAALSALATRRDQQQPRSSTNNLIQSTSRNRSRRQSSFRLEAEDLVIPDPGSLEPVRQGLMTLQTMIPAATATHPPHATSSVATRSKDTEAAESDIEETGGFSKKRLSSSSSEEVVSISSPPTNNNEEHGKASPATCYPSSPLDVNRQWYRGQWIDCLDTVHQWLEATIVDIVRAEDILSSSSSSALHNSKSGNTGRTRRRRRKITPSRYGGVPPIGQIVGASDFDGRRSLLLEPCDDTDIDDSTCDGHEEVESRCRARSDNDGIQLLLIHYNGWPHCWDEWIRSDSERLRPFRTRTRHPRSSPYTSPTPHSTFQAAPSTYMSSSQGGEDESEEIDRELLMPELHRALSVITDLMSDFVNSNNGSQHSEIEQSVASANLPWIDDNSNAINRTPSDGLENELDDALIGENVRINSSGGNLQNRIVSDKIGEKKNLNRQQLKALAPLLDRLGRTLTDAAPHVAYLASTLPSGSENDEDYKVPVATTGDSDTANANAIGSARSSLSAGSTILSLLRNAGRTNSHNGTTTGGNTNSSVSLQPEQVNENEPDLVDFANAMVNTQRGGDGHRGYHGFSSSDDGAGLIGSNLAAATALGSISGGSNGSTGSTLSRLLRQLGSEGGGSGGPPINIHIHAILTDGGNVVDGVSPAARASLITSVMNSPTRPTATFTSSASEDQADVDDLFSDLYTENPLPIDTHNNDEVAGRDIDTESTVPFDEARSTGESHVPPTTNNSRPTSTNSRGRSIRNLFRRNRNSRN